MSHLRDSSQFKGLLNLLLLIGESAGWAGRPEQAARRWGEKSPRRAER